MLRYTIVRLFWGAVTILAVMLLVFVLTRMIGNPVNVLLPLEASQAERQQLAEQLGLHKPLAAQLWDYLAATLQGDFGISWWQKVPTMPLALGRLPVSLQLVGLAFGMALAVAIPLGGLSALTTGSWLDRTLSSCSLVGVCLPNFWLGLMLIFIFGVKLRWLPTSGVGSFSHLILPALSLALAPIGRITLIVRAAMVEELSQPYVLTARAKGLVESLVVVRHALRNACIALVTMSGWELARMLAGYTVAVEAVFAIPGLGYLIIDAIQNHDFPLLQALTLVVAVCISMINLLVDLSYAYIDARIRYD